MAKLKDEQWARRLVNEIKCEASIDSDTGAAVFNEMFDEHSCLLADLLEWSPELPADEAMGRTTRALFESAKAPGITLNRFLDAINRLEREYLSSPEVTYVMLTQVSIGSRITLPRVRIDGVTITFPSSVKSRFLLAREKLLERAVHGLHARLPDRYRWVRASVKAKSIHAAAGRAMESIEYIIALWNLGLNRIKGTRWTMGRREPVNEIALAPVHTLHLPSGSGASEIWWYHPDYVGARKVYSSDFRWVVKFANDIRCRIDRLKYAKRLKDCVRYYGRAMSESNWLLAFSLLWQALEAATNASPGGSKHTVRRASFLFDDIEYHTKVLEDLQTCRNELVHAQKDPKSLETKIYILKRYIEAAIVFHASYAGQFESLDEAVQFLDLPTDPTLLKRRLWLVESAKRFRSG